MKTPWWFLRRSPIAFLLWPVSLIYRAGARAVYWVRAVFPYRSRRPIICVGNIFAGGVGKTPIVREIAKYLDAPVVMRGYKSNKNTANIGDEALMLSRAGLQVHTGNRKSNVRLLNAQTDNTPIVMDDGFQNPRIKKDISILVFDERMGAGNGFVLPAGPLRESMRALRRADAVIIIKTGKPRRALRIPKNIPVFYAHNETVSPYRAGTPLAAFAGIGYPKKFFDCLKNVVAKKSFADHYQYTDEDITKLRRMAARKRARLVTTEKDWVRLPEKMRDVIKYAELRTVIDDGFYTWLQEKIHAHDTKSN